MQDDDWQQQQQLWEERYSLLLDAFAELFDKHVSSKTLNTLIFETGLTAKDIEELKNALE